jgi:hypothetical protein
MALAACYARQRRERMREPDLPPNLSPDAALTIPMGSLFVPHLGALRLNARGLRNQNCGARSKRRKLPPRRRLGPMVQTRERWEKWVPAFAREGVWGTGRARRPVLAARKVHFEVDLLGAR